MAQLRIPVSANITDFKNQMSLAGEATKSAVRRMVSEFVGFNRETAAAGVRAARSLLTAEQAATGLNKALGAAFNPTTARAAAQVTDHVTRSALASGQWTASVIALTPQLRNLAILGAGIAAAWLLASSTFQSARDQLREIVQLSEKAQKTGVSTQFFQQFTSEADKMKVSAESLQKALENAFAATREKPSVNIDEYEVAEKGITDIEKALRVYNATVARSAGIKLQGLLDFRNATDQEQKIRGVLRAIEELEKIGRRAESLDLAKRFFGQETADQMARGQTSAASIRDSLEKASQAGARIFSDEVVRQVTEVDKRLQAAERNLSQQWKPTLESLVLNLNSMKDTWATIVNLIAEGLRYLNQFDLNIAKDRLGNVQSALKNGTAIGGLPQFDLSGVTGGMVSSPVDRLKKEEADLIKRIDDLEGRYRTRITVPLGDKNKGFGSDPTKKKTGEEGPDIETEIANIEKRTARLLAEVGAIDLGTAAREKAKVAAELSSIAAKKFGEESKIPPEVKAEIDRVAEAFGNAQKKIEEARSPLAQFVRESKDINKALNSFGAKALNETTDALADFVLGTKTAQEAFTALANSIIRDLLKIAIQKQITGPLGEALFGSTGGAGLIGGGLGSIFGGGKADGGSVQRGKVYEINERAGPNREYFAPGVDGSVIPFLPKIVPVPVGGGGGGNVTVRPSVTVNNTVPGARASVNQGDDGMTFEVVVDAVEARFANKVGNGRGPLSGAFRNVSARKNLIG